MENEVKLVSDKVVNRIARNEYGQIGMEISQESAIQLITGLCKVAGQVSDKAFNTVAKIYTDALMRQENLEIKTMDGEAEIMRRFNDQVDDAMKRLDFSQPETVECFEKVCNTLRNNLLSQLHGKHKPSLLDKLFKRE